jgi:AmmeMemoRadiSam system protein A
VTENAYAAAFRDPRFLPVAPDEFADLEIHLSLLTPPEPVEAASEADLLQQLRPGEDGLILQEGSRRATFLPAVWESLPEPQSFVRHLKRKAGLPAEYWSDTLTVFRYRAEHIP